MKMANKGELNNESSSLLFFFLKKKARRKVGLTSFSSKFLWLNEHQKAKGEIRKKRKL